MTMLNETWKTTSGLPDDIDIEITDCKWEMSEAGSDAASGRSWDEQCRTVFTYMDEDGVEGELFLNCGKGWEPGPKGQSVVRDDGKEKGKFNHMSPFGYWIRHAAELDGVVEYMGGKDTTKAETWVGTKWHIVRNEEELTMRGEVTKFERAAPNAFLTGGKASTNGSGKSAAKVAASVKSKAKAASTEDEAEETAGQEAAEKSVDNSAPGGKLLIKLSKLAGEHDNHEDYAAAALEMDEVSGNTSYTEWVMEAGNYATLREE